MLDVLIDTIIDSVKLLPFLFITYLVMEYIEHKTSSKSKETIKKSGKFGPFIGAILGIVPQCGFSASATNLYAARIITLGTLISIYLSTSDEMLPILISEEVSFTIIIKILLIKLVIGMIFGFIIDLILRRKNDNQEEKIEDLCEKEHCDCEHGIIKSSIKHTLNIFVYIFIITLILNSVIGLIGEENISNFILNKPILGPMIAGLVGLIPNCAASVTITKLYIENLISVSTLIAGLLVNAGVGLLVLFKSNKHIKENISIVLLLYFIGVISGIVLELIGLTI